MKKSDGFTLVEVLAVITLIAILGLISVPIINNIMKESKQKAFKETLNVIVKTARIYNAESDYLAFEDGVKYDVLSKYLKYENKDQINKGYFYIEDDKYFVYVDSNDFCGYGFIEKIEIFNAKSTECINKREEIIN